MSGAIDVQSSEASSPPRRIAAGQQVRVSGAEVETRAVDVEAENQRAARGTFAAAGIGPSRTRLITGRALEVLPRLTDGAYDIVFVDGDKSEYSSYLLQALRLLRPGGAVIFDNALWHDKVADPAQRDPQTVALRELVTTVREHEQLTGSLLPVGDGLLVAVKRERG